MAAPADRRWLVLVVVAVAQLMVVLDSTVVNIALPSAQRSLAFSTDSRQWVITAYALAFGSLLLLGGKLGDLFGRKWTFIVGLCGFAIVSAIGGLAQDFDMLVSARALQGVFGALLFGALLFGRFGWVCRGSDPVVQVASTVLKKSRRACATWSGASSAA